MMGVDQKRVVEVFLFLVDGKWPFFLSGNIGAADYFCLLRPPRVASSSPIMIGRGLNHNPCSRGNVGTLDA